MLSPVVVLCEAACRTMRGLWKGLQIRKYGVNSFFPPTTQMFDCLLNDLRSRVLSLGTLPRWILTGLPV